MSSSHSFYNCQEAGFTAYLGYEFGFWGLRIKEISMRLFVSTKGEDSLLKVLKIFN